MLNAFFGFKNTEAPPTKLYVSRGAETASTCVISGQSIIMNSVGWGGEEKKDRAAASKHFKVSFMQDVNALWDMVVLRQCSYVWLIIKIHFKENK